MQAALNREGGTGGKGWDEGMGGGKEREERGQGRGLVYVYFHYSLLLHFVNNSTLKYICTVWQDYL